MKTIKLAVNNKDYVVEIDDLSASPIQAKVNGKVFQVTLSETGTPAVQAAAPALDLQEEEFEAYVPDMVSTFVTQIPQDEPAATTASAPAAASGQIENVIAPMPGKVLDIIVKVGQEVAEGDTLCNLEAMKMKSPIRSTSSGKIVQILINEGQNVNYGDVLFSLR